MDNFYNFLMQYGWPLTLIALFGVIALAVMKYAGLFKKLDETIRHYIYLGISIGISLIGTVIYLAIIDQFNINYFTGIASAIIIINQSAYAMFKALSLNELFVWVLDYLKKIFIKN